MGTYLLLFLRLRHMMLKICTPELLQNLHRTVHKEPYSDPVSSSSLCLVVENSHKEPVAGASCWLFPKSSEDTQPSVGCIGHYVCSEDTASKPLLEGCINHLSSYGAQQIVGPMDGSTWGKYRWVLADGDSKEPNFLAEPTNPSLYVEQFKRAGLTLIETYESRFVDTQGITNKRPGFMQKLQDRGICFTFLKLNQYEATLKTLFQLSLSSFSHNPYYTPIDEGLFLSKYLALKPLIDPDCVLIATNHVGELAGFVFAYPDLLQPSRLILKTIATTPGMRILGLGMGLIDAIHKRAYEKGYSQVIHALMHNANMSLKISKRLESKLLRRYGLFGKSV